MTKCHNCGGTLHLHGHVSDKQRSHGFRYRCRDCGKCCTMRDGAIRQLRGRPMKIDQRFAA